MTTPTPEAGDNARQVQSSFVYLMPAVVAAAATFVTLPIFTRILSTEEYGALALATAYGTFASGIANFGLVLSYERNFFQYPSPAQRAALLYSTIVFVLGTHVLVAALTWWFRFAISDGLIHTPDHGALVFWSFCAAGLAGIKAYYLVYLRNSHDAGAYVRYSIDENVLSVLAGLFFVAYLRVGVIGVVMGQVVAAGLVLAFLIVRFGRQLPPAFSWSLLKASLALSYPLTPRLLMGVLATQLDKYLLGRIGSVGAVGIYSIGQKFAFPVFTLTTALGNVFVPRVYERMFARRPNDEDTVGRYLTPWAYVSFGAALGVALFSRELVSVLTAPAYHGAAAVVSVLAMYYAIMFFGKQPQLMFAGKTGLISALSAVAIAVNAAGVMAGIHLWGTVGAAWGTLLSGLVVVGLSQVLGHRYYAIQWEYRLLAAIVGTFFVASGIAILLTGLEVSYPVGLAGRVLLAGAYVLVGIHLRILSRETLILAREALPAFLRRRLV